MFFRRTKEELSSLKLPPKTIKIVKLDLPEETRTNYEHLLAAASKVFNALRNQCAVMQNYASILGVILRLRQVVRHVVKFEQLRHLILFIMCSAAAMKGKFPRLVFCRRVKC